MSLVKGTVLLVVAIILSSGCSSHSDLPQRAEELTRQERFDEAIEAYKMHINRRLQIKNRPEWENPNFYLLAIGDIELHRGNFEAALQAFEQAEKESVDPMLISDRYRYVARKYEIDGNLDRALEVLTKYRDRDPLLFDIVRDRLGKEILEKMDAAEDSMKKSS